jgi:hypothetical protein
VHTENFESAALPRFQNSLGFNLFTVNQRCLRVM